MTAYDDWKCCPPDERDATLEMPLDERIRWLEFQVEAINDGLADGSFVEASIAEVVEERERFAAELEDKRRYYGLYKLEERERERDPREPPFIWYGSEV